MMVAVKVIPFSATAKTEILANEVEMMKLCAGQPHIVSYVTSFCDQDLSFYASLSPFVIN